ncbi:hypothetical protein HDV00_004249 [Rhizophlyctis rosea]|nr:hypothetical protein HDV00_004249 [Rhizophlyctis rosea]
MILTLPPELVLRIVKVCDPLTSRALRRTCKNYHSLITKEDLDWAEAGWRHYKLGINNCWNWATYPYRPKILTLYVNEVSYRQHHLGLCKAAQYGDEAFLLTILDAAQFDRNDPSLRDALTLSVRLANTGIVRALVDAGAVAWPSRIEPQNALLRAVEAEEMEMVELLLKAKVAVPEGALTSAARHGNVTVAKALLRAEANVHELWERPLFVAATNNHAEMVKLLLGVGADVQFHQDLVAVVRGRGFKEVEDLLLAAGATFRDIFPGLVSFKYGCH